MRGKTEAKQIPVSFRNDSVSNIASGNLHRRIDVANRNSELKVEQKVCLVRKVAMILKEYCIPCVLREWKLTEKNKIGPSHSRECMRGRCHICMQEGHDAVNCKAVIKPDQRRKCCRWCFLQYVCGKPIHIGYGTVRNEYGSKERCPFQNLMLISLACWKDCKLRRWIVAEGLITDHESLMWTDLEYFSWLVSESSTSHNGIVNMCLFLSENLCMQSSVLEN